MKEVIKDKTGSVTVENATNVVTETKTKHDVNDVKIKPNSDVIDVEAGIADDRIATVITEVAAEQKKLVEDTEVGENKLNDDNNVLDDGKTNLVERDITEVNVNKGAVMKVTEGNFFLLMMRRKRN